MLWADAGHADFTEWPQDFMGYDFGVYIHAGVWHNQVVQDPYPALIKDAITQAADRGMMHNGLVNGQNFKPFILNLEASAQALWNPYTFEPERYYQQWTTRYFGAEASAGAVQSFKRLHQAHGPIRGYRDVTKTQQKILKKLLQGTPQAINQDANPTSP